MAFDFSLTFKTINSYELVTVVQRLWRCSVAWTILVWVLDGKANPSTIHSLINWYWYTWMLGAQIIITLLFKQPSDEGDVDSLVTAVGKALSQGATVQPPSLFESGRREFWSYRVYVVDCWENLAVMVLSLQNQLPAGFILPKVLMQICGQINSQASWTRQLFTTTVSHTYAAVLAKLTFSIYLLFSSPSFSGV